MEKYAPPLAMELRHNDVAVGRVCAGAVDIAEDELHAQTRFWLGLRALRARVSVCALPKHISSPAVSSRPTD